MLKPTEVAGVASGAGARRGMSNRHQERPADELVSLLARRVAVLEAVLETPRTRPELVEALDISRSTVDRAVRELEGMDLVERQGSTYRASVVGRLAHEEYAELRAELLALEEVAPLLAVLPPDAPLSIDVLHGADVVVAREPAPHVPGSRLPEFIRGAEHLRNLSMAYTNPETSEALADVLAEGGTAEVVIEADLYQYLAEDAAVDTDRLLGADGVTVGVVEALPFGMIVADRPSGREVCLAVYDSDRTLEGILVNDTEAALAWADRVWERYSTAAEAV